MQVIIVIFFLYVCVQRASGRCGEAEAAGSCAEFLGESYRC